MSNKKNTIQVFGLPRSGTNFIEWSIQQYLQGIFYENKYQPCNVPWLCEYGKNVALKHSFPNLNHSEYAIIIYKNFASWKKNYNIRCRRNTITQEEFNSYIDISFTLPFDKVITINHEYACMNYQEVIRNISDFFNIPLKSNKIVQPNGYMDRAGAGAQPSKTKIFKL